jgi:alpha-glucuronidase
MRKLLPALFCLCLIVLKSNAEDGYRLWLRYDRVSDPQHYALYKQTVRQVIFPASSDVLRAGKSEMLMGLKGLLNLNVPDGRQLADGSLIIGTPESEHLLDRAALHALLKNTGAEGYLIKNCIIRNKHCVVITGNSDIGVLYGVFNFLKLLQTNQDISHLNITDWPRSKLRILDHWDNLDRTVERGYAGSSIWKWHKLPDFIDQRYIDYARADVSVGINGAVLNNVNANALSLTQPYLKKAAALANVFRAYGIKVYLSARFSAPVEIGGLKTADPLDPQVQKWWKDKADEIYTLIPDFGGFLVKANSEGQPGPQTYGRNHAEGANMLADAVKPHGGIIMWRAFVYDDKVPDDRAKQAYNEFKPLDGKFRDNVMVQVKNGPIDFQPREPFHPLFGAMPKTPLMMEFQITQEYLGFSTHLVYLAPLFKECLDADTYVKGKGSTVAKVVDGELERHQLSGMAGVANIGSDINWCGHPFAQANWYAFGRLGWNPELTADAIADEWLRMTFTNDPSFVNPVKQLMLNSREVAVNYMTPLGLHHIMARDTHYGPGPWVANAGRADWTAVYYHKADSLGIGFDRTPTGSNATSQYFPTVANNFASLSTCPEKLLLWFHHVGWDYKLKSGNTLWNELVHHYYEGVDSVKLMQQVWNQMQGKIDQERFEEVKQLLAIQEEEAERWRNSCVLYFQQFSKRPLPAGYQAPDKPLSYYENLKFYFVPGIRGVQ